YAAVDEYLTGFENLEMIGRLYHLGRKESRVRAAELLERLELTDAANRPTKTYSGGMRRRLDLAGALVARPPVIFLDEPTTGLDPHSRLELWDTMADRVTALTEAVRQLDTADIELADIEVRRPTLDDVFLRLTGHTATDENTDGEGGKA